MNEGNRTKLIIATGKPKIGVKVLDLSANFTPKSNSLKYIDEVVITADKFDNIGIYDKKKKRFNIHAKTGTRKSGFDAIYDLNCIVLLQDRWIIGTDVNSKLYLYDIKTDRFKRCLNSSYNAMNDFPITICTTFDYKMLYFCHKNGIVSSYDISTYENRFLSHYIDENVTTISASFFHKHLMCGSIAGTISLYDTEYEKLMMKWSYHDQRVVCISYSSYNDQLMLSGGADKRAALYIYNQRAPQYLFTSDCPITACSMSRDVLFAFGDSNGKISIFDFRNFKKPVFESEQESPIDYLQFDLFTNSNYFDTNNNSVNQKSRKFNLSDPLDISEMSSKTATLSMGTDSSIEHRNTSLNQSASSVFSVDDDHVSQIDRNHVNLSKINNNITTRSKFLSTNKNFQLDNESFNISHFVQSTTDKVNVTMETDSKSNRKQVQFFEDRLSMSPVIHVASAKDPECTSEIEIRSDCNKRCNNPIPIDNKTTVVSRTNVAPIQDSDGLRSLIREVVKEELAIFEGRLKSDILMKIVDQLVVTEKNITEPLESMVKQQNRILIDEIERLRLELGRNTDKLFF